MNFSIFFHPEADNEYREAYLWYEQQLPGLGDRFEIAVEERVTNILQNPEKYGKRKGHFVKRKYLSFLM